MLTKVKHGAIGIVLVMVVAATWLYLFDPTKTNSNQVPVTMTVRFDPSPRRMPVGIALFIGTDKLPSEVVRDSPWVETMVVARGTLITLAAIQGEPGALSCAITAGKTTTGPLHAEPVDGGACKVMATA